METIKKHPPANRPSPRSSVNHDAAYGGVTVILLPAVTHRLCELGQGVDPSLLLDNLTLM